MGNHGAMAALVSGSVVVNDEGVATFTPPDPAGGIAGILYTAELAASDDFTVANGGEVPADADRVKLLQWYATRSTYVAAGLVTYLNANL